MSLHACPDCGYVTMFRACPVCKHEEIGSQKSKDKYARKREQHAAMVATRKAKERVAVLRGWLLDYPAQGGEK